MPRLGSYETRTVGGESYQAYLPPLLPPEPEIVLTQEHIERLEQATLALGRLDALATLLPDPNLFIYMFVRKEALLSSQIEGTQSSFSDLLLYENEAVPGVPIADVEEVSNYVAAINHGLRRLREDNFPLSSRLLREIHGILLQGSRGGNKSPGEFRRSQNWLGGSRPGNAAFVPPPFEKVAEYMANLETFLHEDKSSVLIKAALAHVQFETIHPFLDGNGRLGRLLITLFLCAEKTLQQPTLYLSLYFKQNRQRYYDQLQQVRMTGDWEAWLMFFLEGVASTATEAVATARDILALFQQDRTKIEQSKTSTITLRLHQHLQQSPIVSAVQTAKTLSVSAPTLTKALTQLQELGITQETSGRQRKRIWVYKDYVHLLSKDTQPL
jgi:Fic family protein